VAAKPAEALVRWFPDLSDRWLWSVIGVVLVLSMGLLLYRHHYLTPVVAPVQEPAKAAPNRDRTALRATASECRRVGKRTQILGHVENRGTLSLSRITLQVIWKDQDRDVMDTSLVHVATIDDPIHPGERRDFNFATELRGVAACNVRALDWWVSDPPSTANETTLSEPTSQP
jgi:hypothetical protein